MASITWETGSPQKVVINGVPMIFGRCDYTLDANQTWEFAEMVANKGTNQYEKVMTKDSPVAGQCQCNVGPVPAGTYDVTAQLHYTVGTRHFIVNSAVAQVVI